MIGRMIAWETRSIFSSKKFFFAFLFQFVLIIVFVPLLDTYMESLERNEFVSLTPGTRNFVPAASSGSDLLPYLKQEKTLRVYDVGEGEGRAYLERGMVSTQLMRSEIILDKKNPKSEVAKFYITRILQKISASDVDIKTTSSESSIENLTEAAKQEARLELKKTAELVRQNRINVTTMLVLLLPLFVSSGLLLDSLMGEKENRTSEILLALPGRTRRILLSKIVSIFLIVAFQVIVYVLLLYLMNRISNIAISFPLLLTSMLLLSITSFISVYSKSYKEAGFAITILYVILFSFMFGTTTVYALARKFSYLSPLTLIVIIESGKHSLNEIFLASIPTILISSVLFILSSLMYEKDEFQFGPRPSNAKLLSSLVSGIGRSPFFSSILGGFFAVPLSLLLEFSSGVIIVYLLGTGKESIITLILVFSIIEEASKSLGILSSKTLGARNLTLFGALSGASFAMSENLVFLFAINSIFPDYLVKIMLLRIFFATLIHILCSALLGYGMGKNRYYPFVFIASFIHALYNLYLVMG